MKFFPGRFAICVSLLGRVPMAEASAPAGRYTMNNVETVVDTVTGLTWQRVPLMATFDWDAASVQCANLNLGGIPSGSWRLPRKIELESIVDFRSLNPAIDSTAFPNTPSSAFWSSSLTLINTNTNSRVAWVVDFGRGAGYFDLVTVSYLIRCVH